MLCRAIQRSEAGKLVGAIVPPEHVCPETEPSSGKHPSVPQACQLFTYGEELYDSK